MDFKEIKKLLITPLSNSGKKSETSSKRFTNITFIQNLNREALEYRLTERRLLIHTTKRGESLYIQYPGKESKSNNTNERPWDFRPQIFLSDGERLDKDMSFKDIWDVIYDTSLKVQEYLRKEILIVLAILFYRIAFMVDNRPIDFFETQYNDLTLKHGKIDRISEPIPLFIPHFYKYNPSEKIIDYLSSHCPLSWGNLSIEGFLYYNELLTWNEDCKYYYRNDISEEKKAWIGDTGRVNTALTHMMIISFLLGLLPLSRLCDGFNRGRGVAPISKKEIKELYVDFFIS